MAKPAMPVRGNTGLLTIGKTSQRLCRKQSRMFQRRPQPTTTGQLLLEVALFAAENKAFVEHGDPAAAERARQHLEQIAELSNRRLAELASSQIAAQWHDRLVET